VTELDAPLPTDRAECKRVLDAACLALWGGTEWERPRRKRCEMPASWRATIASGMRDKRAA
jgi:hypothetical protein